MYDVESLENKWYKYKRKKLLSPALISMLLLAAFLIYIYSRRNKNMDLDDNATRVVVDNRNSETRIKDLSIQVPSLEKEYHVDNTKAGQIIFEAGGEKIRKKNNLLIQITDRSSSKNIALDIERRFKFTKDKNDAIFLSKYYYDKENYSKSEYWALEANKIDSHLEDGWLLFAKSQVKRGKRIEALRVLQIYFGDSRSARAKSLIDKIRRGKKF